MAVAGRVAIVPRGDYSQSETYKRLDMVRHGLDVYVARKGNSGQEPYPEDTEFWMLMVSGLEGLADKITYDNTLSELTSENVQDALDELADMLKEQYAKKTYYATTETAGLVKPDGKTIKVGDAGEIVGASSGFTGTTAEFETALEAGEIEEGTIVNITDDYQEGGITVDSELSETSENPVQNKAITTSIKNILSFMPKGAASHNGIFRGKDLTNIYTIDEMCAMISDGTFRDLYIGDYFDITINAEGSEVVRCVLAGFDTYLNNGDTAFTNHHAVVVTKNCLTTKHTMNPTNTTVGGFVGSDMWKTVLPLYNTAFGSVLGSHLLSHRTLLTHSINADLDSMAGAGFKGASSNWGWYDTKLSLLSEIQVYGSNVFNSSFYDTGCDNLQLPLFALDPTAKVCGKNTTTDGNGDGGRQWYWLRNVASASHFAFVYTDGNSHSYNASASLGVRPLFCIG